MLNSSITKSLIGISVVGTGVTTTVLVVPKSKKFKLEDINKKADELRITVAEKCGNYGDVYTDTVEIEKYKECAEKETTKWEEENKAMLEQRKQLLSQQKNNSPNA